MFPEMMVMAVMVSCCIHAAIPQEIGKPCQLKEYARLSHLDAVARAVLAVGGGQMKQVRSVLCQQGIAGEVGTKTTCSREFETFKVSKDSENLIQSMQKKRDRCEPSIRSDLNVIVQVSCVSCLPEAKITGPNS